MQSGVCNVQNPFILSVSTVRIVPQTLHFPRYFRPCSVQIDPCSAELLPTIGYDLYIIVILLDATNHSGAITQSITVQAGKHRRLVISPGL